MLHQIFDGIPGEYITNLNVETLESHLVEFVEHNTSSRFNYELEDSYLLQYMEYLDKNLNDVLMSMDMPGLSFENKLHIIEEIRFLKLVKIIQKKMKFLRYLYATEINGYVDHEKLECLETRIQFMANNVGQLCLAFWVNDVDEFDNYVDDILNKPPYLLSLNVLVELEMKKIFLGELKASKFTRSKTFKEEKLPKGFSHHLHSLLMYLKNKKLENFPNNVSAQNVDVAVNFLLFFLEDDVSNHVINGNWLNDVMEKVGALVGDALHVTHKLLPRSINKDDTRKINVCSIQILEKTKDLKAQVETYYKSIKFTPSQFPIVGGLSFLDSLLRKLNEMSKSESGLDFMMKPLIGNLEKELSSLTFIFRDVAKVHHEHEILKIYIGAVSIWHMKLKLPLTLFLCSIMLFGIFFPHFLPS
ncbi:hypothetical protein HAX54_047348 [Datura stramonium]|uniref:Uncharacterized protein n=1 Tax=Datura stramonium TaxID=4076 RepID=A0ABS8WK44_DATST|nr:hypothetical protein [Datura stramonium]